MLCLSHGIGLPEQNLRQLEGSQQSCLPLAHQTWQLSLGGNRLRRFPWLMSKIRCGLGRMSGNKMPLKWHLFLGENEASSFSWRISERGFR